MAFKSNWVSRYRVELREAAEFNDIPLALLAGVAFEEVGGDPPWFDDAGYRLRSQFPETLRAPELTSFGDISIQLRRAAETLGVNWQALNDEERQQIVNALKNPESNIRISAAHLSDLRDVFFPGKRASDLTWEEIGLLAVAYNLGPQFTKEELEAVPYYADVLDRRRPLVEQALRGADDGN